VAEARRPGEARFVVRHTATRTNHAICSRPRHARGDDQRQAHDATTTICRRAREQGT